MLQLKTPSKINLYLKVKDKLPNGYHEIETVFVPLPDISDTITITDILKPIDFSEINILKSNLNKSTKFREINTLGYINSGITISSKQSTVPLDKTNLCYKAADLYSTAAGIKINCNIDIDKYIPVAAGMGGGSSDAAAVLLLLNKKYECFDENELRELALKLGADVPYFLNPLPALGKGVGEKLEKISLANGLYVAVVAPQFPVSAGWAYKNLKKIENINNTSSDNLLAEMKKGNWEKLSGLIYNDLAFALYDKFPILGIIKKEMLDSGALNVEITGSGPTLYGICSDKNHAVKITETFKMKYSESFYCGYSRIG